MNGVVAESNLPGGDPAEVLHTTVAAGLRRAVDSMRGSRFPLIEPEGKLLRPVAALASLSPEERARLGTDVWLGLLAVQMVHEASLLHDDVVDGAAQRRGQPTLAARQGVAAALVAGDHLLTGAYRVALATRRPSFMEFFCRAVEGTVAGEARQAEKAGSLLDFGTYAEIIRAKSGELFGAALALAAEVTGRDPQAAFEAGCRVGSLYQMVDDLLDVCPGTHSGKPPFQDYRQGRWTLPLADSGVEGFDLEVEALASRIFRDGGPGRPPPIRRAVARLHEEAARAEEALRSAFDAADDGIGLVRAWVDRAAGAAAREEERFAVAPPPASPRSGAHARARDLVVREASGLSGPGEWLRYFGRHGTSFRFASRLFPPGPRDVVAGVYAFCRFTDDLVDRREDLSVEEREALLDAWLHLAREAWNGERTGVPLLDAVLGDAARAGVPFRYPEELVEGVRMDLTPRHYPDLPSLRVYSYRVASVVGLWLTERFGTRDRWTLERAEAMGHAMQLTNILRDVGEDLDRGRLYLPLDRMAAHGVDPEELAAARRGGAVPAGYRPLMEELLARADADYEGAFPAIAALPLFFQRPVAVAARVYQGIHREIRRNGHDNLRTRARTSLPRKGILAAAALSELRRVRREHRARVSGLHGASWLRSEGSSEPA